MAAALPPAALATGAAAFASTGSRLTVSSQSGSSGILLAIGDSLAAGYQPIDGTRLPPVDPATGLPDGGYPGGYAADVAAKEHLRLIDLGCPGETTASFTTTPAQKACAALYEKGFAAANQQAAAEAVLRRYRGQVRLVTFDLGANDLDGCLVDHGVDASCVAARTAMVLARLPPIVSRLEASLVRADPTARLVAMDYYDPYLALEEDPGGARGTALAALSLGALEGFDASLRELYHRAGAEVAAVSSRFETASLLPLTAFRGHRLPRDVAVVCRLTYMCPLSRSGPASRQDIHPNTGGYARIAAAFEAVLEG